MSLPARFFFACFLTLLLASCGGDDPGKKPPGTDNPRDPILAPTEPLVICPELEPLPEGKECTHKSGDKKLLIRGDVLLPGQVYQNGSVAVDEHGIISCVGCDCAHAALGATEISCPNASISPGLINAHDHLTFSNARPLSASQLPGEGKQRYNHRHDWRMGGRGLPKIKTRGGGAKPEEILWGELRFLIAGATSTNGQGAAKGALRNLDAIEAYSELPMPSVNYQTFPLGDSKGIYHSQNCDYPAFNDENSRSFRDIRLAKYTPAFTPHIAEGIDDSAHNEFSCLIDRRSGGYDAVADNTAIIHGIGLTPPDVQLLADRKSKLIWSPRSNISLYGATAPVTLLDQLGVTIALGSDWLQSGSMNILRELNCAATFNENHLGHYFSEEKIWRMATVDAAKALGASAFIGVLKPGMVADISVFKSARHAHYGRILYANAEDVALVIKGGRILFGNAEILESQGARCEEFAVCGKLKRICLNDDAGMSYAQLGERFASSYPLFFCGRPIDEPSCTPSRSLAIPNLASPLYSGTLSPSDTDGDGIANAIDNCPDVFNPPTPLDRMQQGDFDHDGKGDACDSCPFDALTNVCHTPDSADFDRDGIVDAQDNCPDLHNTNQSDLDLDAVGDICDPCPAFANPNQGACNARIRDVKTMSFADETRVSLSNVIVGAVSEGGFFAVQEAVRLDPVSQQRGIYVFASAGSTLPKVGDTLNLQNAKIQNFYGQIQLSNPSWTLALSEPQTPFVTRVTLDDILGEHNQYAGDSPYEGMLIELGNLAIQKLVSDPPKNGVTARTHLEVDRGLMLDSSLVELFSDTPAPNARLDSVSGVLLWRKGKLRLMPRTKEDIHWHIDTPVPTT